MLNLKEVADATILRARELFPNTISDDLKITYSLEHIANGTMGHCVRKRRGLHYHVAMNPALMVRGGVDESRETLVHEICHALDDCIVGGWGHANGWRMLMKLMGYSDAKPCHRVATVGLRGKKQKFLGVCNNCGFNHALTMTQHDRMLRGLATPKARCAKCAGNSFRPLSE